MLYLKYLFGYSQCPQLAHIMLNTLDTEIKLLLLLSLLLLSLLLLLLLLYYYEEFNVTSRTRTLTLKLKKGPFERFLVYSFYFICFLSF